MKVFDLINEMHAVGKRAELIGDTENGVLIALDIEGRTFTYMNGEILNRVNMAAVSQSSTKEGYINPGGDGLWPAPEGSSLGYEYSTDNWRVPPALTNARWFPLSKQGTRGIFQAEVDLINASGIGLPFIFYRDINVQHNGKKMDVSITEGMEYIGTREYTQEQAIVAPWSLCQFDCGKDTLLRVHKPNANSLWDLYQWDSACHRHDIDDFCEVEMTTDFRFQLGLSPEVNWLEFIDSKRGFSIRRTAAPLASGFDFMDIADKAPSQKYSGAKPIRFSAYCDPSGFMEIEAAGGAPAKLTPGCKNSVTVIDSFTLL